MTDRSVEPSPGSGSRRSAFATVLPVLVLLAIMWVLEILDFLLPWSADGYGIESRSMSGLPGVLLSPVMHADFAHLLANTIPFLVLGSLVAWRSGGRFWIITLTIAIIGGLTVWLLGPTNVITIGASGLIFGYLTYLITAGILTRHWLDIAVGIVALLLYGGVLLTALPFAAPAGVSWLAHLGGAAAGVVSALWFARSARDDRTRGQISAAD